MIRAFTLTAACLALALSALPAHSTDTENSSTAAPTLQDGDRGVESPVPAGNILKDGDTGVETPVPAGNILQDGDRGVKPPEGSGTATN